MNENLEEIINGSLLGDATVGVTLGKYFTYAHTAKDYNYLKWQADFLESFDVKHYITADNKKNGTHRLGIYINATKNEFLNSLHSKWYMPKDGRNFKIAPSDLQLTPTVLLHWYLGDGCLVRQKSSNRIPRIVFATNNFTKEDVDFLIEKLKSLGLNFYSNAATSGFNNGAPSGYVLISKSEDGTPFRFFKLIGLECPKEIENYTTGSKGRGSIKHYFKNKWPTEEDWLRILSNTTGVGKIIKQRRFSLKISQGRLAKRVGCGRNTIKRIERGVRFPSVDLFRKISECLEIKPDDHIQKTVLKNISFSSGKDRVSASPCAVQG